MSVSVYEKQVRGPGRTCYSVHVNTLIIYIVLECTGPVCVLRCLSAWNAQPVRASLFLAVGAARRNRTISTWIINVPLDGLHNRGILNSNETGRSLEFLLWPTPEEIGQAWEVLRNQGLELCITGELRILVFLWDLGFSLHLGRARIWQDGRALQSEGWLITWRGNRRNCTFFGRLLNEDQKSRKETSLLRSEETRRSCDWNITFRYRKCKRKTVLSRQSP